MVRGLLCFSLVIVAAFTWSVVGAQDKKSKKQPRARAPKFDKRETSSVFFDDVFSKLDGERPQSFRVTNATQGGNSPTAETSSGGGSGLKWSEIITDASIEDEIKSIKFVLADAVATPSVFRGEGHETARNYYTLLTALFFVIENYDQDVRWKDEATVARQQFASVAGNSKAGGNEQVFTQAKRCFEMVDQMMRGEKLGLEPMDAELDWSPVHPRPPLMTLLSDRFEENLKAWTSSDSEFEDNVEELLREAELVGMIGQFLMTSGLDDADDEEYQAFTGQMKQGAADLAAAIRQSNLENAQRAVGLISKSCDDCHDVYR